LPLPARDTAYPVPLMSASLISGPEPGPEVELCARPLVQGAAL